MLRRQGVKIEVVSEIVSDLNRHLFAKLFRLVGRPPRRPCIGRRSPRRFDRHPPQNRGVGEIGLGDDADPVALAHEQRLGVDLAHLARRQLDRRGRVR